jgi:hypothetical protein
MVLFLVEEETLNGSVFPSEQINSDTPRVDLHPKSRTVRAASRTACVMMLAGGETAPERENGVNDVSCTDVNLTGPKK